MIRTFSVKILLPGSTAEPCLSFSVALLRSSSVFARPSGISCCCSLVWSVVLFCLVSYFQGNSQRRVYFVIFQPKRGAHSKTQYKTRHRGACGSLKTKSIIFWRQARSFTSTTSASRCALYNNRGVCLFLFFHTNTSCTTRTQERAQVVRQEDLFILQV